MPPVLSTPPNAAAPPFRKKPACDVRGATGHAAGTVIVAPDGSILLLRRSKQEKNFGGHWALPGGGVDAGETPEQGAAREMREEIGKELTGPRKLLDQRRTPTGMIFHTFIQSAPTKFAPKLNDEHSGYDWADVYNLPSPLHPAVERTLSERLGAAEDMTPEDWDGMRSGLLKWISEEEREPEHGGVADAKLSHEAVRYTAKAKDPAERCGVCEHFSGKHCELVVDPIQPGGWCMKFHKRRVEATDSALRLALDKSSVRSFDSDGRMRVSIANISKATVNPYRGEEIPGWEELGLERDKVYQMLRDPEELKASAATFNGIQLLKKHVPVDAADHQMWDIVGCTGTEADFDGTYLTNSLSVWTKEGIDYIESGDQRELSCGYHYVPDMTPGKFDGKHYDGVMRDIEGNHVALVEEGRAGHDVVVGDSALEKREDDMKPTRLAYSVLMRTAAAVNPLLAMDAQVNYAPLVKGLTTQNFRQRKPAFLAGVKKAISGKTIAKDASLEHLAKALDMFEAAPKEGYDESVSEPQHKAMEAAAHGKSNLSIPKKVGEEFSEADRGKKFGDMIRDWAKDKGMSDDDLKALDKMHMDAARDDMPEAALDEEEVNIEVEEAEDDDMEDAEDSDIEEEEAEDSDIEREEGEDRRGARDRKSAKDKAAKDKAAKDKAAKDKAAKDAKHAKDKKGAMDTKRPITQDEMNRAIAQERKRAREAVEARAFVRPFVGDVPMALDSAEGVFRSAARQLGVEDADTIHSTALKTLITLAGRRRTQAADHSFEVSDDMAMDTAETDSFDQVFGTGRIQTM